MHLASQPDLRESCREYLSQRTSSYWFRCRRYKAVADKLFELGLDDSHTLVDAGAGRCDFDYYLRVTRKWRGRYVPVDGSIDGTNLEIWKPPQADFFTAIEVAEHLHHGLAFIARMVGNSNKGVVITTPNPRVGSVLAMDPTHVIEIFPSQLRDLLHMKVEERSFFGKPNDSLLAWRRP